VPSSDRIDELKKRYDENPRRFFASLANEYRKAGDLEQAISLCQAHLTDQPGNMNGHVVYGQALFEAGRYDEAKTTFETALTLDPENLIALRHLGDIACQNGANDEAREWYKRVLDADPRNDEIIALLENLEQERVKDALGGPVASAESANAPVPRTEAFKPPTVITPLANQVIAEPTPVVPIDAVDTVQIPSVQLPPTRPSRESIGLMDISLDFETNSADSTPAGTPSVETPVAPLPAIESNFPAFEEVSLGTPVESNFPAFEEVTLGTPLETHAAEPMPDLDLESFGVPQHEEELVTEQVAEREAGSAHADITSDMLFGDSVPAEPAPPFVTETMAELYLQQGFTAEALEVYRQLSDASPGDENLKERVRKLEHGDRSSLSLDVVHEEHVDAAEGAVPIGAMIDFGATPVAPIASVPSSANGHSARAYFAALASRRAVQGNGRAHPTPTVPSEVLEAVSAPPTTLTAQADEASGLSAPAQVTSAPVKSVPNISTLDSLFDGAPISPEDETLALAFSQVAGAVEMGSVAVKGKPTAPAASALSLDSVFRDADSRGTNTPVPRQSQTLRFDQFFATAGDDAVPQPPPASSAPAGEPGSPAELQQFQSWLGGLKKP
jgi:tetratricopeptide (TPR) repeat protein